MSRPVDVLAVMDAAALTLSAKGKDELCLSVFKARLAVAELVEAVSESRRPIKHYRAAEARISNALAKFGGAK